MRREDHRSDVGRVRVADLRYSAVPARADQLPAVRHSLAGWAQNLGMGTDQIERLVLATYEALANVVTHAYRNLAESVRIEPRTRGTTVWMWWKVRQADRSNSIERATG